MGRGNTASSPLTFFNILRSVSKAIPILLILAIWEGVTQASLISTEILPTFSSVLRAAIDLIYSGIVVRHLLISLYRAFGGLASGILVGIILGFGMAFRKQVKNFFDPIVTLTYPIPKVALVPLTMVWLGVTDQAAIFVIFLACLLPMIVNTYNGARSVEQVLIWSALSLGTGERGLFRKVILPATMPYIFNGIRVALPFSFIVVISVELVASKAGVGYLISGYGGLGIYDYMFATILIFIIFSFAADRLAVRLMRRILRWYEEAGAL
jgi:ABC-type nitrate/sulfonate/bicarbonate transport system permease component